MSNGSKKPPPAPKHEKWRRKFWWGGTRHAMKLDVEVLRRKVAGENTDFYGNRINLNRSAVLRDLIDEHLTLPDRMTLGHDDEGGLK